MGLSHLNLLNILAGSNISLAARPLITLPTAVDSPAAYTTSDTVLSQQWSLDGIDSVGATGATFTQLIADSSKALRVRDTTTVGVGSSYPTLPGLQNLKLSNTTNLRAMLAGGGGLILTCGDSSPAGFLAGGGTGVNSEFNMRPNSFMAKLVAGLNSLGFPASKDGSFGTGNFRNSTPALFAAMDPRWSFTGSIQTVLGGFPTYGGALLGTGYQNTTALSNFTPGNTFDLVTTYCCQSVNAGSIAVSVDGGATTLSTIVLNASNGTVIKTVIPVPAGSTTVTFKYGGSGGGDGVHSGFISGVETSTVAAPKIRVINGALSGTTVQLNAAAFSVGANAYVPRVVMSLLAATTTRGILALNGWYNDQSSGRTLVQIKADYKTLCDEAVARGWDIWYIGYTTLDPATITKVTFDSFEQPIMAYLRDTYNAVILQESDIFPDYTTYSGLGYYGDGLHLGGTGHQKIADSLTAMCKLAASGDIPP